MPAPPEDVMALIRAILDDDEARVRQLLATIDAIASTPVTTGATRQNPTANFIVAIRHYTMAGDTGLHMAGATYRAHLIGPLVEAGGDVHARNRRGQQPLHYAVDGTWDPSAQRATVEQLLDAGADPDAPDKGGTGPLHRAIRNRCADAVAVLLARGADPMMDNGRGNTPLRLAQLTTGKGGSGSPEAKVAQARIVRMLEQHGAR